jgi:hypothetical protein
MNYCRSHRSETGVFLYKFLIGGPNQSHKVNFKDLCLSSRRFPFSGGKVQSGFFKIRPSTFSRFLSIFPVTNVFQRDLKELPVLPRINGGKSSIQFFLFSSVNLFFRFFSIFFRGAFFQNLQRTPFVPVATGAP